MMTEVPPTGPGGAPSHAPVSLQEFFWTWCRVAAFSFGGPAGQIAVMHRILVEEKKWISEERFLHALNYCMLLPGPEAQQLATYIGWLMHRTLGGVVAGVLFVLPGFVSLLALSLVYARFEESSIVQAVFFGLKPAVIAIVMEAVLRIGRRVLKNGTMVTLAAAAFVAIFFFDVPFPILIVASALIGLVGGKVAPARFAVPTGYKRSKGADTLAVGQGQCTAPHASGSLLLRSVYVSACCLALWFSPLAVVALAFGASSVYFQEGVFFSKAAVVTFGGAYSVLAYVAQQAVERYGWLRPGEMLDGLGMAETTPGPLIMVVQFVGFMAAYRNPGPFSPLVGGIVGSLVTTWVTFVPCFLWIFLGAPYVERMRGNERVSAALSAITATVVGVVLNLAVWFSLHTLFREVSTYNWYLVRLQLPSFPTVDKGAWAIAVLAGLLTFYWKKGMGLTLGVSAAAGAALFLASSAGVF